MESPTSSPTLPQNKGNGARIMIIDDDPDIASVLREIVTDAGHEAVVVTDPRTALEVFRTQTPDLITLDLMMPGVDGMSLCLKIRQESDVPVLFLSAKQETPDRVVGLRVGADDYLGKPFDADELIARIEALLRRSQIRTERERAVGAVRRCFGDFCIDSDAVRATKAGVQVQLTPTEFRLLKTLASEVGRVFPRDELLPTVWGYEPHTESRLIDVHVGRLRHALKESGVTEVKIETSRGFGYRLVEIS